MPSSRVLKMRAENDGPGRWRVAQAAAHADDLLTHGRVHDGLLGGLGPGELGGDAALAQDHDPVGHAEHLGQLGRHHHDGEPVGGQRRHQPVHLGLGADVDAAGRLVDDQQFRVGGQPLGQHDLLLVAAGQGADRVGQVTELGLQPLGPLGRLVALGAAQQQAEPGQLAGSGQGHVALDRQLHDQALLAAVLGDQRHAGGHRGARRAGLEPLAEERDGAGVVRVDAEHRLHHLGPSGPDQTGQGDDLAGAYREADVGKTPSRDSPLDLEHDLARLDVLLGEQRAEVAADHPADHVVHGQVGDQLGADVLAVPHDRDPLAERGDLLEAVRDEHDRGALVAQRPDHREEPLDLDAAERRGRLVHDQDPGLAGQRLGDLDQLLVGDGQAAGRAGRVDVHAQPGEQPWPRWRSSPCGRSGAAGSAAGCPSRCSRPPTGRGRASAPGR